MADLLCNPFLRRVVAAVLIVLLTVVSTSAIAQDQEEVKSYAPYPEPGPGYVTDYANMLTDEQEERIEQWLWDVEEETGVEIVVVTINAMADYSGTPQDSIESFATGLFDAYGIGNLPENDGVLLLVSRYDRKARIELGKGYGRYRDRNAAEIMQHGIIPRFQRDDYAGGIESGVIDLMREFAGVRVGTNWSLIWGVVFLIVGLPAMGLVAYSLFKSGKRGWGWVVVGIMIVIVLLLVRILFQVLVAIKNAESNGRGSSSGWSSGGHGGGFGGGSSGGGGATGSW